MVLIATFPSIAACGQEQTVAKVYEQQEKDFPILVEVVKAGVVLACMVFREKDQAFEFADEFTRW